MGTRDRQENRTGPQSIERHFDRVSIDQPQESDQDQGVTSPAGVGRSGAGMGVSRGDYTDVPPDGEDRPDSGKDADR